MAACKWERPGGREGKDSTSQRGLASASLASQWAGAGSQTSGKVAAGGVMGLGTRVGAEGRVCMRNSHVFPPDFQLLLRAGWVWTLAVLGKPDGAFQPEATDQVLLDQWFLLV